MWAVAFIVGFITLVDGEKVPYEGHLSKAGSAELFKTKEECEQFIPTFGELYARHRFGEDVVSVSARGQCTKVGF